MDDLISRQAAIDAIDSFVKVDEENCITGSYRSMEQEGRINGI